MVQEQQYHPTIGNFAIDAALQDELKNRLAPFHHDDLVVQKRLIRDHGLGFPFTEVKDINPHAHQPIKQLVLPKEVDDFDLRAMVLSQSGDLDEPTFHEYTRQQLPITTLPDNYACEDMVEAVMMGAVDRFELGRTGDGERWRPDEDYVRHMPFQGSMLHLARYYRSDTHQDWLEPVVLVVGDTVEDFCLYYCLSRLHDGVFWLPKKWLDDCYRRHINNGRLYRKGRPTRNFSENARIARAIVQLAYKAIDYGHHEKRIEVRSASLSIDELRRTIRSMSRVSWAGGNGFARHATPKELSEPSTKCVARVIEENNYMNQQEMVFIARKSVGRLATPKPKNFSLIHPARHWWLTSLHISEYTPPTLSFLGKQIALTFESRVARDGVVYLCPSIGFFGGDIDVNLTRPQLVMVTGFDMMRQYLGEVGLEIQPSDKGNYLTDTISRFGDLAAAATFIRDPRTRAILDLFLIEQSAEDGHVVYLQEERRAVISYTGVSKCVGPDAAQVIDALASAFHESSGWFVAGGIVAGEWPLVAFGAAVGLMWAV